MAAKGWLAEAMRVAGDTPLGADLTVNNGTHAALVVSDQPEVRLRLKRILAEAWPDGLQIFFARDADKARSFLREGTVAIVFSEIPSETTLAAEHLLLLLEYAGRTPVIAVGHDSESSVWPTAIGLGAQDYLSLQELAAGDVRRIVRYAIERQHLQMRLEENLGELEKAKTQFQSLITDNADALVIVSHDMVVRYANPAAEHLLGQPLADLVGSPFQFQLDTRSVVEASTARNDGSVVVLAIRYMDTLWEGSRAYIASLRDITARKTAEEALALAKTRAEGASKMKSQFLANMSHELRTPLNSILGFSQLMDMEIHGQLGSNRYKGYVENIANAGSYLLELINDLLDLSKIEAGQLELVEASFDLSALIESVAEVLEPRIESADLELQVLAPPVPLTLLADERKIKQVLFNLLSNAVKFTPTGGAIQMGYRINRTGHLVLFVCDNGVGIPSDQIPKALSAFGQVENAYTRNQDEGTGLGLTLSKRISELHGGSLKIRSAVGRGTNVMITLPGDRIANQVSGLANSAQR